MQLSTKEMENMVFKNQNITKTVTAPILDSSSSSKSTNFGEIYKSMKSLQLEIDKRGKANYASWSTVWECILEIYPETTYEFLDPIKYQDDTYEVVCRVNIEGNTREMTLPVMDHKYNAVKNPNAWQFNTAKMRCLVKCIAMFGLGLYVYKKEDLPPPEPFDERAYVQKVTESIFRMQDLDSLKDLVNQSLKGFDKESNLYKSIVSCASQRRKEIEMINNGGTNESV